MQPAVAIVDPILSGARYCDAVRAMGLRLVGIVSLPDAFFRDRIPRPDAARFDRLICETDCGRIVRHLAMADETVIAVIAGSEAGVGLADRLGNALGVAHNDLALLPARRNRYDMKRVARRAGLACAAACKCYADADLEAFVAAHGFPVVLKTPAGTAISQVFKCDDWRKLRHAFAQIVGRPNPFHEFADHALIEQHIAGEEYSVDLFADASGMHVTGVWQHLKVAGSNGDAPCYDTVQIAHDELACATLHDHAIRLAKAVGIRIGPAHATVKLAAKGPVMIGIGACPAAGHGPSLLRRVADFDPYKATIEAHLDGRADVEWLVRPNRRAWLVGAPIRQSGRVCAIHGLHTITSLPSYVAHRLNVAVGDHVEPSDSRDTAALLVCLSHPDPDVVRADARRAHAAFALDIGYDCAAA
jgi:biotin carboxylase